MDIIWRNIASCLFVLCLFPFCFAIRVQSVSEAREAILQRYVRQGPTSSPGDVRGNGVFGNDTMIFTTPCVRMEAKGAVVSIQNPNDVKPFVKQDLTNATSITVTGGDDCSTNGTTSMEIKFGGMPEGSQVQEATLQLTFRQDSFYWWIQNMTLDVDYANKSSSGNSTFDLWPSDVQAGRGNAYLCQDQYAFRTPYQDSSQLGSFQFLEVIIQPFINDTNGNATWGMTEPCEYAFTLPLWMATVTGLIMALILALGISMLVNIKTPDRFDDPKTSKLLSVPSE